MSKELHKAIMKRSILRNKFLKHRTNTNKKTTAPRHFCKKRLKNTSKFTLKILTLKKIPTKEVSGRLSHNYLHKRHQKVKKLTPLMLIKPYLVTRSSVRYLINFFSNVAPTLNIPKPKQDGNGK